MFDYELIKRSVKLENVIKHINAKILFSFLNALEQILIY